MMESLAVIVLAAGKGTRMFSPVPKVLHRVAGQTIISHVLETAMALRQERCVVVTGGHGGEVRSAIARRYPKIALVTQEPQRGTGDAVRQALPLLDGFRGITLVIYGDTPLVKTATLQRLIDRLKNDDQPSLAVLGFEARDPAHYGRLILGEGDALEGIVEYRDASDEQRRISWCNSGIMAFRRDALPLVKEIGHNNAQREYYLTDAVALARAKGMKVSAVMAEEREVTGINTQTERAGAEKIAQEDLRARLLESGVTMIAPETVFLCRDTEIAPGAVVHPYVVFGPGVSVGGQAEIKSFSHIEGALIKDKAVIGPFARIRPGSSVGEGAKVGNFVEIKNAALSAGAKVNHLSYVGDASVGENTNIGAGTVTCNYDGFGKHRSEIGKNVFVGSHTTIIAPAVIGDGAVIGAGTTLLEDVPPDAMAVNKKEQRIMSGGALRYREKRRK